MPESAFSRVAPTPRLPALFFGHGNPMNAIDDNAYSRAWAEIGARLPKPQAILCVCAHWTTTGGFFSESFDLGSISMRSFLLS